MKTPLTAGKRARNALNRALSEGVEWTEAESLTLGLIEDAVNRVEVLKGLLAAAVAEVPVSSRRVIELSAEIRQHQVTIEKWVGGLDPEMSRSKSARHVHAANARWARGSA